MSGIWENLPSIPGTKRRRSEVLHESSATETSVLSSFSWRCWPRKTWATIVNFMARTLVWSSFGLLTAATVWYSYELTKLGTDPHIIVWLSAGAFVILGFPISMWGIIQHLANYNQPHVQCYIVRILWMVPIYSTESWLCLRFHRHAIYIETLRDCYESYVLYCFLQFLIQVLGGEEALVLMLKDKSPTRGFHMWGLQYTGLKPWLMGQPVRVTYDTEQPQRRGRRNSKNKKAVAANDNRMLKRVHWKSPFFVKCKFGVLQYVLLKFVCSLVVMILEPMGVYKEGDFTYKGGYLYVCILTNLSQCWALYCLVFFYLATKNELSPIRPVPKFLSVKALVFFTWWQSVCISILYGMNWIPHYHSAIGAMMASGNGASAREQVGASSGDEYMPLLAKDALDLDELGGASIIAQMVAASSSDNHDTASSPVANDWSSEDVAKGLQAYLICIEMFVAAIVHSFVFPHSEYTPQAVEARARALNQKPNKDWNKRLGRRWKEWDNKSNYTSSSSTMNNSLNTNSKPRPSQYMLELAPLPSRRLRVDSADADATAAGSDEYWLHHPNNRRKQQKGQSKSPNTPTSPLTSEDAYLDDDDTLVERRPLLDCIESAGSGRTDVEMGDMFEDDDEDDEIAALLGGEDFSSSNEYDDAVDLQDQKKPNFVSALLDSAIPQDLRDNTVGIIKGDYVVEKRTLLHHAATSDSYDLFSRVPQRQQRALQSLKAAGSLKPSQPKPKT